MRKRLLTIIALVAVAACGGSNQTANNPSPSVASTPSAAASASPTAPATLDPCQLVTKQEASQLAGVSYTTGVEQTASNGAKLCLYGRQTLNVFMVEVIVAPDAATAQADWAKTEADAQAGIQKLASSEGASVSLHAGDITLSGADRAAAASASGSFSGHTLSISAIYVLKGAVFFMFSDLVLDKQAPTTSALATQATTVLTRIP